MNKSCGNCKHFFVGPQFNECHRYPIQTTSYLLGIGPKTRQYPNGTPIEHLAVRYALTNANTPACGEWHVQIEIVASMNEVEGRIAPPNANGGTMP